MREILFRAKKEFDGEWVYGNYCAAEYLTSEGTEHLIIEAPRNGVSAKIIAETVGQYIGVEDKNGKKVFEGDILRYTPRPKCTIYYKVIWNQEWSRFALMQWSTYKYHLYEWAQHETIKYCCEVIGNIHDNPDLLESLESN